MSEKNDLAYDGTVRFICNRCDETIQPEDIRLVANEATGKLEEYHIKCFDKEETLRKNKGAWESKKRQKNPAPQYQTHTTQDEENETLRAEIILALAKKQRAKATEYLSDYIKYNNHIYTTRDDNKPEMWIYRDGIYTPNGQTHVKEIIRKIVGTLFTSHLINEVIYKIETDTYVDQDEFLSRDTEHPHLVPVQNGLLNINTKELVKFTPDKFFFNKIPVTYDKNAKCPAILQFIEDITYEADRPLLQEYAGFILLREYKHEKSLMLTGSGRNGKGKFLQLLTRLVGSQNTSNISLQDMETDQFALGALHGKLANIAGDISKQALRNTGNFKALVGRDTIQANRKFKTRIQFVNYAKMLFSANDIPRTTDMSEAFFDRWLIVTFPYKFLPQAEIDKLPKAERKHIKVQKQEIIDEITSEEELSGFLNWCLEGYARLSKHKTFTTSHTSESVKELWIRKSDSFMAFCMDHVEEDWEGEVEKAVLRQEYHRYCREHKVEGTTDKVIKHVLAQEFGASEKRTGDLRVWVGISIKRLDEQRQGRQPRHGFSPLRDFEKFSIEVNTMSTLSTLSSSDEGLNTPLNTPLNKNLTIQDIANHIKAQKQEIEVQKLHKKFGEPLTTACLQYHKERGNIIENRPGKVQWLE